MLKALRRLISGPSIISKGAVGPIKDLEDDDFPRYPPFAKGFPVAPIEKVLGTQAELIERIRNALGLTREEHERLLLPVITNFASFVHFLPASEGHHHRGAGGLFRHGLEVAFWAAQASEAVMFAIEGTPRERRSNEPRWRLNIMTMNGVLKSVRRIFPLQEAIHVPVLSINYSPKDTMPDMLDAKAKELDLTVEQLVKRFITAGMSEFDVRTESSIGANALEDYMVLNEVSKKS